MIPTYETGPIEFDYGGCRPAECGTELLGRFDALRPLQTLVLTAREDPAPLLARLQAERPDLFEWSPLQEGPRVWRVEIARRKSQPGEAREITEALEWDHDRLDRLERRAFDAWAAGHLREAEAAFALFAHGLRRHIGFEEALIFPEFERRTGAAPSSGPTMTMRTEHRQILALVAALELAIVSDVASAGLLRQHLHDILRSHNRKEEEVLYPITDSVLTQSQRDDIMRRVQLFHSE